MSVCFSSQEDAFQSLQLILKRSFSGLSANYSSVRGKGTICYINCSTKRAKRKASSASGTSNIPETANTAERDAALGQFFGPELEKFSPMCTWKAHLRKSSCEESKWYFSKVDSLHTHSAQCFSDAAYQCRPIVKQQSQCTDTQRQSDISLSLFDKTGTFVGGGTTRVHRHREKKDADKQLEGEFIKWCDHLSIPEGVSNEDKAIIGALECFKSENKGFCSKFTISEKDKTLDFVAFLWSSQKEALKYYGDLMFIDSTFNISVRDYKAINLVVVDNHFRSLFGAVAFTKHDDTHSYSVFLEFIKENVAFERLPLCLISDSAAQIHMAVSKAFPYCRHIYCAFHLYNENALFGGKKKLEEESQAVDAEEVSKKDIKDWILTMLTTRSQLRLDNAICNLRRAMVDPKFTGISTKIGHLLVHGVNGSRPLQDVFTADSVASSRIESRNRFSKSFGLDGTTSLLRSVLTLKKLVQFQELSCFKHAKKSYPFASDTGFSNLLSDELRKLATDEVLEQMYNEYKLSHGRKYCVALVSDGKYDVVFNDKATLHDTHHVEHSNEGGFHCWCCVRTGFPCRHVFAVAEFMNLKITHTSVNSRFFLDQSHVDFCAENNKRLEVVMQSLAKKKEIHGGFFLVKRFRDVSTNIEDGVDVVEKFKTALEMFGIKESE